MALRAHEPSRIARSPKTLFRDWLRSRSSTWSPWSGPSRKPPPYPTNSNASVGFMHRSRSMRWSGGCRSATPQSPEGRIISMLSKGTSTAGESGSPSGTTSAHSQNSASSTDASRHIWRRSTVRIQTTEMPTDRARPSGSQPSPEGRWRTGVHSDQGCPRTPMVRSGAGGSSSG